MENKLCEAEVKKNIILVETGKPLTLPLNFLNKSCEFKKVYDKTMKNWYGCRNEYDKTKHKEYAKSQRGREAAKKWRDKNRDKINKAQREYNKIPKAKAWKKEYNSRPEVKIRRKKYLVIQRGADRKNYHKKYNGDDNFRLSEIKRSKEYYQKNKEKILTKARNKYHRGKDETNTRRI